MSDISAEKQKSSNFIIQRKGTHISAIQVCAGNFSLPNVDVKHIFTRLMRISPEIL